MSKFQVGDRVRALPYSWRTTNSLTRQDWLTGGMEFTVTGVHDESNRHGVWYSGDTLDYGVWEGNLELATPANRTQDKYELYVNGSLLDTYPHSERAGRALASIITLPTTKSAEIRKIAPPVRKMSVSLTPDEWKSVLVYLPRRDDARNAIEEALNAARNAIEEALNAAEG